jgi:exonuclease III
MIGITEIYPKNCRYLPGKAELQMEGYELLQSESTSFSKRGAALYINKKLKSEEIKFNVKFEESVWAQIRLNNNDMLLLGCIYKSPSSSPDNLDELNKLLTTVSKEKKFSHIMAMGDFNFPKLIGETGQPRVTKIVKTSEKVSEIAICSNMSWKTLE